MLDNLFENKARPNLCGLRLCNTIFDMTIVKAIKDHFVQTR